MGVHLETFHKASVYKLFSSPLSQEGPLGPHLEASLCYWIQSLKAIKLHSKQFIQYTLPPNRVWQAMVTFLVVPSFNLRCRETEGDIQWLWRLLDGGGSEGRWRGGKVDEDLKEEVDCGLPLANGFVSTIMYSCLPFSPPIPGRHSFLPQLPS